MKQEYDGVDKAALRSAIIFGAMALVVAIVGTGWFGFYQSRLLHNITDEQSFYKDLVECRASLAALEDRLGKPGLTPAEMSDIQDRLVLERARFAETGRREALRKGGRISTWLNSAKNGREEVDHESLGLMLVEMDAMISLTAKNIGMSSETVGTSLHIYLVFIVLLLFTIVLAAGRLLVSNYRHSLQPLNLLARRLTQLNRNLPESVHDTAEAASNILCNPDPSPEIRYVTESVAGLCREIEEKNKKLDEIYIRDEKTNLYNYRHFKEHLIIDVERAKRFGDKISLAMIDIDFFKRYNDSYGHIVGDKVLARIAEIIREQCRVTDIPSRFGGEEFAILFPKTGRDMAIETSERFRQIISAEPFDHERHQPGGQLTVSIGVATWPDDAADWYSLINNADQALYAAKAQGRNRVVAFVPSQAQPTPPDEV
jgi:diguanylate cyclase (GGDEF)-like protein